MENTKVLFLYSDFSPSCKSFISNIKRINITFFKFVNIDNKKSRTTLKKIGVTQLPCIIVSYDKGEKEIFQGEKAYIWFEDVKSKLHPRPIKNSRVLPRELKVQEVLEPEIDVSYEHASMERVEPSGIDFKKPYTPQSLRKTPSAPIKDKGTTSISSLIGSDTKTERTHSLLKPADGRSLIENAKKMAAYRDHADVPIHKRGPTASHSELIDVGKLDETADLQFDSDSDSD